MATIALHTAASGLSALSTEIDVRANNIANVNTIGFKGQRVNFEDLLYQHKLQPGVENAAGDAPPAGIQVGLGVRVSDTQPKFEVGSPIQTGNDLDMMIEGDGFFQVRTLEQEGTGIGYTRAGNFFRNPDGELVLGNSSGSRLEPPINIPVDATSISISRDGTVSVMQPGAIQPAQVGQIELADFVNPAGLKRIGGNRFVETPASGPPITGAPGEDSLGPVLQHFIESSNVDPVEELVGLIKTQRAFELNSQTIQAADEVLQVISNLRR